MMNDVNCSRTILPTYLISSFFTYQLYLLAICVILRWYIRIHSAARSLFVCVCVCVCVCVFLLNCIFTEVGQTHVCWCFFYRTHFPLTPISDTHFFWQDVQRLHTGGRGGKLHFHISFLPFAFDILWFNFTNLLQLVDVVKSFFIYRCYTHFVPYHPIVIFDFYFLV